MAGVRGKFKDGEHQVDVSEEGGQLVYLKVNGT
jgi:hypothetical protein